MNERAAERRTRGPAEPRYQEEAQPAENSNSQYGWLQMRGQGWVWIGAWEIGKPPEAGIADSSTYVQSNLYASIYSTHRESSDFKLQVILEYFG